MRNAKRGPLGAVLAALASTCPGHAQADEPAASAAQFDSFATPYLPLDFNAGAASLTCSISNVGPNPIRVKGFKIRSIEATAEISTNTCPSFGSFSLQPGKSCGITSFGDGNTVYACLATADDVNALRGSLDVRNASGAVLKTMRMTSTSAEGRATFASPPMYASATQREALCVFLNVGTTTVKVSDVRIVTLSGQSLEFTTRCTNADLTAPTPPGMLVAGGFCTYQVVPIPPTDLQCRGVVMPSSDVRAALNIVSGGTYKVKTMK